MRLVLMLSDVFQRLRVQGHENGEGGGHGFLFLLRMVIIDAEWVGEPPISGLGVSSEF